MAVAEASCMRSAQLIPGYFSLIGFSHPTALSRPTAAQTCSISQLIWQCIDARQRHAAFDSKKRLTS